MNSRGEAERPSEQDETTPLLTCTNVKSQEEEQPKHNQSEYRSELLATLKYAGPLVLTNFLQYSLRLTSLLFAGRVGKTELGALALSLMTANITGFTVIQGFATALDTVCPEAYAAGKPHLVGLYCQKMSYILLCICCLVALLWAFSGPLLALVIPDEHLVQLTAALLRNYVAMLPAFAAFEVGKRYIRSQGSALPLLYFLCFGVPVNLLFHWVLITVSGWGILGAPIASAITQTVLFAVMLIYINLSNSKQCWDGFQKRAFHNWYPLIALGIPDLIMSQVDSLSWEILTLLAAYLSNEELAAQTVLSSVMASAFQIPFPLSVAASFQIASAIGSGHTRRARVNCNIALLLGCLVGLISSVVMITCRNYIPKLFSADPTVQHISSALFPLLCVVQLFDASSVTTCGVLRGLGRQKIGSIAMLVSYYLFGLPFSAASAFGLHWRLQGMWMGLLIAVFLVTLIDVIAVWRLNFDKCVERANHRTMTA